MDNESMLTLTDENGVDTTFEYLDCVEDGGKEYLVLSPQDEPEQIVILAIEPIDGENEQYLAVEDEGELNRVYGIFKEKYKDILTFQE